MQMTSAPWLRTSIQSLEAQVNLVRSWLAAKHYLKLNVDKCWVVGSFRDHQTAAQVCEVEGSFLLVGVTGKCLGFGFMATKSFEGNIRKHEELFFFRVNLGSYQGDLDPLSNQVSCGNMCWWMVVKARPCLKVFSCCWKPFQEKWPSRSLNYQSTFQYCHSYWFWLVLNDSKAASEEGILMV